MQQPDDLWSLGHGNGWEPAAPASQAMSCIHAMLGRCLQLFAELLWRLNANEFRMAKLQFIPHVWPSLLMCAQTLPILNCYDLLKLTTTSIGLSESRQKHAKTSFSLLTLLFWVISFQTGPSHITSYNINNNWLPLVFRLSESSIHSASRFTLCFTLCWSLGPIWQNMRVHPGC